MGSKITIRPNNYLTKIISASLVLIIPFLLLSFSASANLDVDVYFNKDTFHIGEDADLQLYFSRSVTYTIKQVEPIHRTIISNRHANRGHHSIDGSVEEPTGRKTLKVIAEDEHGNRASDTFTYRVVGGGQDNSQDGGSERFSLSYFKSRKPPQAGEATSSLQNQIEVIRPGDSGYDQLNRDFQRKGGNLDISREKQSLKSFNFSFNFGSSEGEEFSIGQGKQDYYSLNRSLQNQGVTFFGSSGNSNYLVGGGTYQWGPNNGGDDNDGSGGGGHGGRGRCICRLPCSCFTCCQPIYICLPGWVPWPLPTPWLYWVIMIMG